MSQLSTRLYELESCIDIQTKQLLKMQLKLKYVEQSIMIIRQYGALKAKHITDAEIEQLIQSLAKPTIPQPTPEPSFHKLKQRADKIMMKQYALKNIAIFKHRENLGEKRLAYMQIGIEINQLNLSGCAKSDVIQSTRDIFNIETEIKTCNDIVHSEDEKLLKFDIPNFYKQIKQNNHVKLQKMIKQKGRQKTTIHLQSKNKKKKKKSKTNDKPKISNDISHKTRCKYTQLINFRIELTKTKYALNLLKSELTEAALRIHIVDKNNKCQQESAWTSVLNNDLTVKFRGKKAFERVQRLSKSIRKCISETDKKIKKVTDLLDETVWRTCGKFKNKKSMMERVADYEKELYHRRMKYRVEVNHKTLMKQLVSKKNGNMNSVEVKSDNKPEKSEKNNILKYFNMRNDKPDSNMPPPKKRKVMSNENINNINNNNMTTKDLIVDEDDDIDIL